MSTITSTTFVNYADGSSGVTSVVGYESSRTRVARFQFTSPSGGASSYSVKLKLSTGGGSTSAGLRFYITTSSTSHTNPSTSADYHGTLNIALEDGVYYASGDATVTLTGNTIYYLYIFPATTTYGWWYHGESVTITTSGSGGSVYIYNGSSWSQYAVYIYNGSSWSQYIPYVYNGSSWNECG